MPFSLSASSMQPEWSSRPCDRRCVSRAAQEDFHDDWPHSFNLSGACCRISSSVLTSVRPSLRPAVVQCSAATLPFRSGAFGAFSFTQSVLARAHVTHGERWRATGSVGVSAGPVSTDAVAMTFTLGVAPAADRLPILAECHRVLKPRGRLVIAGSTHGAHMSGLRRFAISIGNPNPCTNTECTHASSQASRRTARRPAL